MDSYSLAFHIHISDRLGEYTVGICMTFCVFNCVCYQSLILCVENEVLIVNLHDIVFVMQMEVS